MSFVLFLILCLFKYSYSECFTGSSAVNGEFTKTSQLNNGKAVYVSKDNKCQEYFLMYSEQRWRIVKKVEPYPIYFSKCDHDSEDPISCDSWTKGGIFGACPSINCQSIKQAGSSLSGGCNGPFNLVDSTDPYTFKSVNGNKIFYYDHLQENWYCAEHKLVCGAETNVPLQGLSKFGNQGPISTGTTFNIQWNGNGNSQYKCQSIKENPNDYENSSQEENNGEVEHPTNESGGDRPYCMESDDNSYDLSKDIYAGKWKFFKTDENGYDILQKNSQICGKQWKFYMYYLQNTWRIGINPGAYVFNISCLTASGNDATPLGCTKWFGDTTHKIHTGECKKRIDCNQFDWVDKTGNGGDWQDQLSTCPGPFTRDPSNKNLWIGQNEWVLDHSFVAGWQCYSGGNTCNPGKDGAFGARQDSASFVPDTTGSSVIKQGSVIDVPGFSYKLECKQ